MAGGLSEKLVGRMWIHKLPDHKFYWSRLGLETIFGKFGFVVKRSFCPLKYISPLTVLSHLGHKFCSGTERRVDGLLLKKMRLQVLFNFGEHGLLFERVAGLR